MTGGPDGPVSRAADLAALGHRDPLTTLQVAGAEQALARHDDDPRVRAAALGALVRGGGDAAALRAWFATRRDPAPSVRRRAAELAPLLPPGAGVAEGVVSLLGDAENTVVEAAAWASGELGARAIAAGAVESLARLVTDHPDAMVREAAVAALGALGHPAGLTAVLAACSDRPAVRRRAVLALAPFEGTDVDAALARALTDHDWQVRQAAEDLTR